MESIYSVADFDVLLYEADNTELNILIDNVIDMLLEQELNVWNRLSQSDMRKYFKFCLRLYYTGTHGKILSRMGKQIVPSYTRDLCEIFLVPRNVRDIFREYCRPMSDRGVIYIPEIDHVLPKTGTSPYDLCGLDNIRVFKIHTMMRNLAEGRPTLSMVHVSSEALADVAVSLYHSDDKYYWHAKQLPDWRLKSFYLLRHFRFAQKSDDATISSNDPSGSNVVPPSNTGRTSSTASSSTNVTSTARLTVFNRTPQNYANCVEVSDNRFVNGVMGFVTLPTTLVPFYFETRFPSGEEHSKTPPPKRVSEESKPRRNKG
jgi:hypothetical protein